MQASRWLFFFFHAVALIAAAVMAESKSPRAFYILFAHDIDGPAFPTTACSGFDCSLFDTFIVQANFLTRQHVEKLHALAGPTRKKVLMYFDTLHTPIISAGSTCSNGTSMGEAPGKTCGLYGQCGIGGEFLVRLRRVFPPTLGVFDLKYNRSVCTYPGLVSTVPSQESAPRLGALLSLMVNSLALDGLYLDNSLNANVFTRTSIAKLFASSDGTRYDANGDGRPETYEDLLAQYAAWRGAFTFKLRQLLGKDAVIIGNSAGALSDPSMNGLTIEMEACMQVAACADAVMGQRSVSKDPPLGVFWLTHSESMPPEVQCQRVKQLETTMPWMQAGTDFFDKSHIVCKD